MQTRTKDFTLEDHLKESLKEPTFKKVWDNSSAEYKLLQRMTAHRSRRRRAN